MAITSSGGALVKNRKAGNSWFFSCCRLKLKPIFGNQNFPKRQLSATTSENVQDKPPEPEPEQISESEKKLKGDIEILNKQVEDLTEKVTTLEVCNNIKIEPLNLHEALDRFLIRNCKLTSLMLNH